MYLYEKSSLKYYIILVDDDKRSSFYKNDLNLKKEELNSVLM